MKTVLIALLFMVSGITLPAQKNILIETKEEVIKKAISELDLALASPDGALYKFIKKKIINSTIYLNFNTLRL